MSLDTISLLGRSASEADLINLLNNTGIVRNDAMSTRTVEQLIALIAKDHPAWVLDPRNRRVFLEEPTKTLQEWSDDARPKGLVRALNDLSTWYLECFTASVFKGDAPGYEDLRVAVYYKNWAIRTAAALIDVYPKNPLFILFSHVGACIAAPLLLDWPELTETNLEILTCGLRTALIGGRPTDYLRHPWFLLHLLHDWQGRPLDIPPGPRVYPQDLGPYEEVLQHWKSPDSSVVDHLVDVMADFHVRESREPNRDIPEFEWQSWWLTPFEIHAVLRLRQWLGLPNPETYRHPLMNQPLGSLPPSGPIPEDPLLTHALKRFKERFPALRLD